MVDITIVVMGVLMVYKPTFTSLGGAILQVWQSMRWISSIPSWKHLNFYLFGDCYREKCRKQWFCQQSFRGAHPAWRTTDENTSKLLGCWLFSTAPFRTPGPPPPGRNLGWSWCLCVYSVYYIIVYIYIWVKYTISLTWIKAISGWLYILLYYYAM